MAAKDIEKLKEKFEKDPNSKLFLPLAEEYRKEGLLDQAIEVLQKGLERHQAYTSAKVLLGRIYHEKGMLEEARKEFEGVVASVPDNLFAYKKLSEIYRDSGETDLAIQAFRAILKLNPMDGETLKNLEEMESPAFSEETAQESDPRAEDVVQLKMPEEEQPQSGEVPDAGMESESAGLAAAAHTEDELHAFKESLFGGKGEEEEETLRADEEVVTDEDEILIPEGEESAPVPELTFEDVAEEVELEEGGTEELAASDERMVEQTAEDFSRTAAPHDVVSAEDFDAADRFIAGGEYAEAMGIYRRILSADPDNKAVLQRANELSTLVRLTGKDKELRIAALDAFLAGIKKGRDDFFGRS